MYLCPDRFPGQVERVLADSKPDVVVFAAKETPAAAAELSIEKDPCSNAAGKVVSAAAARGAWTLYISCDSVYCASAAPATPITPDTPTSPHASDKAGWYKALSERAVLAAGGEDVGILRVPRLVGPLEKIGESEVTVLAKLVFPRVKAGERVDDRTLRQTAHVRQVANICVALAEIRTKTRAPLRGIWHYQVC
jgi:dTDP-4-dehydrorhamnose reductase